MNPISPDIIPDGKWRFDMRPMIGVRTRDDVGEVYIMDRSIPNMIRDVERVTIGKQVYLPERTCHLKPFKGQNEQSDVFEGVCSECSAFMHSQMCYCPNCGRKVVE